MSISLANLLVNLLFIDYKLKKKKITKKKDLILALLDSNIEIIIQSFKKTRLFLRLSKPLVNINERAINILIARLLSQKYIKK